MRELALFAGAGGGILGGYLNGWRTVCAVEIDDYARRVLLARQNDGTLRPFPVWDDIRTFDGRPWRGSVDVVSGGFPCQDISAAGRGAGITGAKSGLWSEMRRIVGEVDPDHVYVENSPLLRSRGLETVLTDLAGLGFDARWGVLGAADVGAPHLRRRIWIAAHTNRRRLRFESGRSSWAHWPGAPEPVDDRAADLADPDCAGRRAGWRRGLDRAGSKGNVASPSGAADVADAASCESRSRLRQDHEPGSSADRHQPGDGRADVPDTDVGAPWPGRREQFDSSGEAPVDVADADGGGFTADRMPDRSRQRHPDISSAPLADSDGERCEQLGQPEYSREQSAPGCEPDGCSARGSGDGSADPDALGDGRQGVEPGWSETPPADGPGAGRHPGWWESEPDVGRVADGVADRVDRLTTLGNGQVPAVAAEAWELLNCVTDLENDPQ